MGGFYRAVGRQPRGAANGHPLAATSAARCATTQWAAETYQGLGLEAGLADVQFRVTASVDVEGRHVGGVAGGDDDELVAAWRDVVDL